MDTRSFNIQEPPTSIRMADTKDNDRDPNDDMQLLTFLQRAVPAVSDADGSLQYVAHPPPIIPVPPPPPPHAPVKHHRRPEPVYQPRPATARAPKSQPRLTPRPLSARPAPPGRMIVLPTRIDAALANGWAPSLAEAVVTLAGGPSTLPPSPRAARWKPVTKPWSDWSVANEAYPSLGERPASAVIQPARRRYAHAVSADDNERDRRWRPSTAPVRSRPTPRFQPPTPSDADAAHERFYPSAAGHAGVDASSLRAGGRHGVFFAHAAAAPAAADDDENDATAGNAQLTGLGAIFNKKRPTGSGMSLKSTFNLARRLSAGQQRAKAKEKERIEAEHEAHIQSLRTALGTPVDPAAPGGCSTASAIEATMEEELRLAIPPPRDRSPQHLGRTIDKLETRLGRELSGSPNNRGLRGKGFMQHTGTRRNVLQVDDSGAGAGATHGLPTKSPRVGISGMNKSFATARDGGGSLRQHPAGGAPQASGASRPLSASSAGKESGGREMPPSVAVPGRAAPGAPAAPAKSPRSYGLGPIGKWADDDGETLEALPMPLPRHRLRSRSPRKDGRAPPSVLASTKEHSLELQLSLETCSPLLKRESLRKMISRILDDPTLLPPGAEDHGEAKDAAAAGSDDEDD